MVAQDTAEIIPYLGAGYDNKLCLGTCEISSPPEYEVFDLNLTSSGNKIYLITVSNALLAYNYTLFGSKNNLILID